MRVLLCVCYYACVTMRVLLCVCYYACVTMRVLLCVCYYACVTMRVLLCVCYYACVTMRVLFHPDILPDARSYFLSANERLRLSKFILFYHTTFNISSRWPGVVH